MMDLSHISNELKLAKRELSGSSKRIKFTDQLGNSIFTQVTKQEDEGVLIGYEVSIQASSAGVEIPMSPKVYKNFIDMLKRAM